MARRNAFNIPMGYSPVDINRTPEGGRSSTFQSFGGGGFAGPRSRFAQRNPEAYFKETGMRPEQLGTGDIWNPETGMFEPPMTAEQRAQQEEKRALNLFRQKKGIESEFAGEAATTAFQREKQLADEAARAQAEREAAKNAALLEKERIGRGPTGPEYGTMSEEIKDTLGLWTETQKDAIAGKTTFTPSRKELSNAGHMKLNSIAQKYNVPVEVLYSRYGLTPPQAPATAPTQDPAQTTMPEGGGGEAGGLPNPAQHSGRRIQLDDGTILRSNGSNWIPE